ncbi:T2SSE_N domain-containing protein [Ktedonobacteria bacterium brp13]|nr:T2SSE_N domain-containing protein [Ktedonobacteria bacterium brp13]
MGKEYSLPDAQPTLSMTTATPTPSYSMLPGTQDLAAFVASLLKDESRQVTQFALIALALHFHVIDEQQSSQQIEQSMHYYSENLRPLIRRSDTLIRTQRTLYFVLVGANQQGGRLVQERLWEALLWSAHSAQESAMLSPYGMTIGSASTSTFQPPQQQPIAMATLDQVMQAAAQPQHSFTQSFQDELEGSEESGKSEEVATGEKRDEPRTEPLPTLHDREESVAAHDSEKNLSLLARRLGIPYLSLLPRNVPEKLRQICSPQLAQELHCYPIGKERNTLTVALADPSNHSTLARLRQETGLQIFPVLAPAHELQLALEQM